MQAVVTKADDEVRFVEALKTGKLILILILLLLLLLLLLLEEAIKQQTEWYGDGLVSLGPPEFPHWGHGGGAPGNSAALSIYPTNDMIMVCLSNRDPPKSVTSIPKSRTDQRSECSKKKLI